MRTKKIVYKTRCNFVFDFVIGNYFSGVDSDVLSNNVPTKGNNL